MTPSERIVRLLLRILNNPYVFTKKDLAKFFNISEYRIKQDIQILKNIGFHVEQPANKKYAYAILPEKGFKELKYLQSLTSEDQAKISRLLHDKLSTKEATYLVNKLSSLYNFQQLGLRALRRPALDRIDRLKHGKKNELQVILKNYRSNRSNQTRDRLVEAFEINVELDTIQAYEVNSKSQEPNKHFRLSRIERVELTPQSWQFKSKHRPKLTDVFRIADYEQVRVHLKIDVQAYNYLAENYPKSLSEIYPASEPNTWDFETNINEKFYGLSNFILANSEHVKIIQPQHLRELIRQKAQAILDNLV